MLMLKIIAYKGTKHLNEIYFLKNNTKEQIVNNFIQKYTNDCSGNKVHSKVIKVFMEHVS